MRRPTRVLIAVGLVLAVAAAAVLTDFLLAHHSQAVP
jgi:hypothetical protein